MDEELAQLLDEMLPPGWEHDALDYGYDFHVYCPCGDEIEQDGVCPDGHVSPLRAMGWI